MSSSVANVFGTAITENSLKGLDRYADRDTEKKPFTAKELAEVAVEFKNLHGKNEKALEYLERTRAQTNAKGVMCMIYNATGAAVKFFTYKDWQGKGTFQYPQTIGNGQWGAFFHAEESGQGGSVGAVVYTGRFAYSKEAEEDKTLNGEWMFAWRMGYDEATKTYETTNSCDVQVFRDHPFFATDVYNHKKIKDYWAKMEKRLRESNPSDFQVEEVYGDSIQAYASIGNTHTPVFEAIMSIVPLELS